MLAIPAAYDPQLIVESGQISNRVQLIAAEQE